MFSVILVCVRKKIMMKNKMKKKILQRYANLLGLKPNPWKAKQKQFAKK